MEEIYKIVAQLENKKHSSKVYHIEEVLLKKGLILKIYDNSKIQYYQREHDILTNLDNNYHTNEEKDFFILYKNIQFNQINFAIPGEININNEQVLFYDYLKGLSLLDYIVGTKEKIKEIHAKYLCYKLLKSIEKLNRINICHNNIDDDKIMFDENYNLKIIDYAEAKVIENSIEAYKLNRDIFCIGQVIAKVISLGNFVSIVYNKKKGIYEIYTNGKVMGKYIKYEESEFWEKINLMYNIDIPENFLKFFRIILNAKKSKEKIDIKTLLNNAWLKEIINDNEKKYETLFKKDFAELYNIIIEDNKKESEIQIKVGNILEERLNEFYEEEHLINSSGPSLIESSLEFEEKNEEYLMDKYLQNEIYDDYEQKFLKEMNYLNIKNEIIFEPEKYDFNYLKINIKNPDNYNIEKAIEIFMENFRKYIKEEYKYNENIEINIDIEKESLFYIQYKILPIKIDDELFEFLDENFERKIKNKQEFEIKVEIIEGDKSLYEKNEINQFYLIFSGISIDKVDFYYILKELKKIAIKFLLND